MKIHIDTSPPKKNATSKAPLSPTTSTPQQQKSKKPGASGAKTATGTPAAAAAGKQAGNQPTAGATMQPGAQPSLAPMAPQKPTPKPIPKKAPKESKPPDAVARARKRRSDVLKERQTRETNGALQGPDRDTDAGTGFGPALIPYLL